MRIQRPTITQIAEIKGDGAILTGSFSGSFTGEYNTAILSSSGQIADLGAGILSGSAQIGTDISGSFTAASSSISTRITTAESELGNTLLSSSAQIATDISGSLGANATLIRSLTAAGISGSSNASSASFSTRVTSNDTDIAGLNTYTGSLKTAISVTGANTTLLGNLTVQGTQTALDTATLNVADLNILVASGAADNSAANGAGLTVDGASATFTYTSTGDKWNLNKDLDLGSNGLITAGNVDGVDVSTLNSDFNTLSGKTLVSGSGQIDVSNTTGTVDISSRTNFAVSDTTGQTGIDLTLTDDTVSGTLVGLGTTADVQFDSFGVGTAASGTTGEIRATGDITAYYSSDERLKENFTPLAGALDKVKAIGGYEFDWKDGIEDVVSKTGHDIGVKAQELQAQYPELVHERDNGYLAVDYIKLNAVLIEAVKELAAKVEELSK